MQYLNSLSVRVFINSTITRFIVVKATDQPVSPPIDICKSDPVRVGFAEILRGQLKDLSQDICAISSLYSSATGSNRILNCAKLSHRLWTNNVFFTNLNVTCAMKVMLVSHVAIPINALININTPPLQSASISKTARVWFQLISATILAFQKSLKTSLIVLFLKWMFFIDELKPILNVQCDSSFSINPFFSARLLFFCCRTEFLPFHTFLHILNTCYIILSLFTHM